MKNTAPLIVLILLIVPGGYGLAQFTDDFNDLDLTSNPEWLGDTSKFIVNADTQLQLDNVSITDAASLYTQVDLKDSATWKFYFKMDFDPSASNYLKAHLSSNVPPGEPGGRGYYFTIGETGSDDAIELFEQTESGDNLIFRGTDGLFASSPEAVLKIRVAEGEWDIEVDTALNGQFVSEGTVAGFPLALGHYFGIECHHTSTRSDKFYFDDFYIAPLYKDDDPPAVQSIGALSDTVIQIAFSELIDTQTAMNIANYNLLNASPQVTNITAHATLAATYRLSVDPPLQNKTTYELEISGIQDLAGNEMATTIEAFTYFIPQVGDLLMTELFPDPNPTVNLPEAEFVEIYNPSGFDIDLEHFQFSDNRDTVSFPAATIAAGEYVILCDANNASDFSSYGKVIGLGGFPTLNNGSDELSLFGNEGTVLDYVAYESTWYRDNDKAGGGWTLERIPAALCKGAAAWIASFDPNGGTPGSANSTSDEFVDTTAPSLVQVDFLQGRDSLFLQFSEALYGLPDTVLIAREGNVASVEIISPTTLIAALGFTLEQGVAYDLYVSSAMDCYGNKISITQSVIDPFQPEPGDLVINEILFNPASGGVDYVELYNRSNRVLTLNKLQFVERDALDEEMTDLGMIEDMEQLMNPGEHFVFTTDPGDVEQQYTVKNPKWLFELNALPNWPDDAGILVLAKDTSQVFDSLVYSSDWHYELLADENGVSLERISIEGKTNDAANWFSASSASGYGTPTYKNSQFFKQPSPGGQISVSPEVFSPDQDGYNDLLTIALAFEEPGFSATVHVYDSRGRFVRELANNVLLSSETVLKWDGLNSEGQKANPGIYVVYFKIFNPSGITITEKRKCVLGEKR